jgi:hypothetical protein
MSGSHGSMVVHRGGFHTGSVRVHVVAIMAHHMVVIVRHIFRFCNVNKTFEKRNFNLMGKLDAIRKVI